VPPPLPPTFSWNWRRGGGMMPRPPPERMLRAATQRADPSRRRASVSFLGPDARLARRFRCGSCGGTLTDRVVTSRDSARVQPWRCAATTCTRAVETSAAVQIQRDRDHRWHALREPRRLRPPRQRIHVATFRELGEAEA
jgi:hypothetical protein